MTKHHTIFQFSLRVLSVQGHKTRGVACVGFRLVLGSNLVFWILVGYNVRFFVIVKTQKG